MPPCRVGSRLWLCATPPEDTAEVLRTRAPQVFIGPSSTILCFAARRRRDNILRKGLHLSALTPLDVEFSPDDADHLGLAAMSVELKPSEFLSELRKHGIDSAEASRKALGSLAAEYYAELARVASFATSLKRCYKAYLAKQQDAEKHNRFSADPNESSRGWKAQADVQTALCSYEKLKQDFPGNRAIIKIEDDNIRATNIVEILDHCCSLRHHALIVDAEAKRRLESPSCGLGVLHELVKERVMENVKRHPSEPGKEWTKAAISMATLKRFRDDTQKAVRKMTAGERRNYERLSKKYRRALRDEIDEAEEIEYLEQSTDAQEAKRLYEEGWELHEIPYSEGAER